MGVGRSVPQITEREAPFCSVGVRRPPSWGASGISSRLGVGSPELGYCAPPMCWWENMYFQLLGWIPGRCSTDVLNTQGQGCLLLTSFVLDLRPMPS